MLRQLTSLSMLTLSFALGCEFSRPAFAASPETAPSDLVQTLNQIEAASDSKNLEAVMAFYASAFASADGFNRAQFEETLQGFWDKYSKVDYEIDLVSWEASPNGVTVETLTRIKGTQTRPERELALEAEVRSRQRFENGQIVYQEILSEHSQVTSGTQPPVLSVLLPEQIKPGSSFAFDAIVQEPLGERSLLGTALDEGVTPEDFFAPRPLILDVLSAGGLFKVGQAPEQPDNRWVSAVVIQENGMTIDTRRLRVGE